MFHLYSYMHKKLIVIQNCDSKNVFTELFIPEQSYQLQRFMKDVFHDKTVITVAVSIYRTRASFPERKNTARILLITNIYNDYNN